MQWFLAETGQGRSRGKSPEELSAAVDDELIDVLGQVLLLAYQRGTDVQAVLDRKWLRRQESDEPLPVSTELIARAVIRSGDRILVVREHGKHYCMLPGGHVEPGEPVEDALTRELSEELGVTARVGDWVAVIEHSYVDDTGTAHHELNLVFTAAIVGNPDSREAHFECFWLPTDRIAATDLRPHTMKDALWDTADSPIWRK
ncbi:NUDIX domain-containing protein [Nocardia sp. CDC159]|uniref:NUDIX domain-containing protein n=2 Tax=Nocardiaceae TaxID=85025 RepID=A0A9X2E613_9NOCA|nr:NUDIX domain-containing protein [Nocardia pulmonis]MCM6787465.1 NUDIX domain-containing protein [Nocardia sp. CDC159]